MKTKEELKAVVRIKMEQILTNIENDELMNLVKNKTFLSGGVFKDIMHETPINDWDLYFMDQKSATQFVKMIKENKLGSKFKIKAETKFAVTLKFDDKDTLQFITKFSGHPEVVTQSFDFEHSQNYYIPSVDNFNLNGQSLKDKQLRFNTKATHPIGAMQRMTKFIKQGWTISNSEIVKIAEAINALDLKNKEVREEHIDNLSLY